MPRPYAPPPAVPPTMQPFLLSDADKRDIARVLGLEHVPLEISEAIAHAIAAYKATEAGSADTTVANTLAALNELGKEGRNYDRAVARIAHDRSAVDYTTHGILQPLAKAVLANESGARETLARASSARAEQLRTHMRVETSTEPLRFFAGILRLIFDRAAAPVLRRTTEESWHSCRHFAMEVFTIADIDHADFDAHPELLTEYLGTDVTID